MSLIPVDGAKVKAYRLRWGLSQYELARRSQLSRSYISDLEAGRRQPRRLAAQSIAEVLGVEVTDLIGDTP